MADQKDCYFRGHWTQSCSHRPCISAVRSQAPICALSAGGQRERRGGEVDLPAGRPDRARTRRVPRLLRIESDLLPEAAEGDYMLVNCHRPPARAGSSARRHREALHVPLVEGRLPSQARRCCATPKPPRWHKPPGGQACRQLPW